MSSPTPRVRTSFLSFFPEGKERLLAKFASTPAEIWHPIVTRPADLILRFPAFPFATLTMEADIRHVRGNLTVALHLRSVLLSAHNEWPGSATSPR